MADDTSDTPPAAPGEPAARTPRRRAAPRKTAERKPADRPPSERKAAPRAPKGVAARAAEAVAGAATSVKDAAVDAEQRVARAVKPRAATRAAARPAPRSARTTAAKPAARSRKTDEGTTRQRKTSGGRAAKKDDRSVLERATDRVGGRWAAAALAGVAAAGATAAAVLSLRGSSARGLGTAKKPIDISGTGDKEKMHPQTVKTAHAHQPDGTDSSASFQAGIADENTVPDEA